MLLFDFRVLLALQEGMPGSVAQAAAALCLDNIGERVQAFPVLKLASRLFYKPSRSYTFRFRITVGEVHGLWTAVLIPVMNVATRMVVRLHLRRDGRVHLPEKASAFTTRRRERLHLIFASFSGLFHHL